MSSTREVATEIATRFPASVSVRKMLADAINAALQQREREVREQCAVIAETSYEQFQTGYNAGKWIAAAIRRDSSQEGEQDGKQVG